MGPEWGADTPTNSAQSTGLHVWQNPFSAEIWRTSPVVGVWLAEAASCQAGYTITMSMSASSGNPAINLYAHNATNWSAAYLTDPIAAQRQFVHKP